MYWLFNEKFFKLQGNAFENISWDQARNFKGTKGDSIIFYRLERDNSFFTYLYNIDNITTQTSQNIGNRRTVFIISLTLRLEQAFKSEKELSNYIYSFPRIRYYDKYLSRHFRNKYYRLSSDEFIAIVNDEIFRSRTILGVALNALHIDHRLRFLQLLTERFPNVIKGIYDHQEVLNLFIEYFTYAIIIPSRQILAAYEDLQEILTADEAAQISFSDDNQRTSDSLVNQVATINEYIGLYQEIIQEGNGGLIDKYRFEDKFKNKPLPIDLNT